MMDFKGLMHMIKLFYAHKRLYERIGGEYIDRQRLKHDENAKPNG